MATFTFELVSPERVLFSGPVAQVVVPGAEGDMAILANHAPVMTTLRSGIVSVSEDKGTPRRLFVAGGFADVTSKGLTILAERAIPVEEIDAEKVAKEMRDAEEDARDAKSDADRADAVARLESLKAMLAAVRH